MTSRELSALIDTYRFVEPIKGLRILCKVTDAKTAYGVPRLEIIPLGTSGRAWVNLSRTTPTAQKPEGH